MEYAKINKSTGEYITRKIISVPNFDETKDYVWVPIVKSQKPAFNIATEKLEASASATPMPFVSGSTEWVEVFSVVSLNAEEKKEAARSLRAKSYVSGENKLGDTEGDFIKTIGDVIDVIIAELDAVRAGGQETQDYIDLKSKIAAVKSQFPEAP